MTFLFTVTNTDYEITKNLKLSEVNTGNSPLVKIHPLLIIAFRLMRDTLGKPLKINSGYRSPNYNRKVGGRTDSQHMDGTAIDISAHNFDNCNILVETFEETLELIREEGNALLGGSFGGYVARFTDTNIQGGIGIYHKKNFVHIDVRKQKARWNE